MSQWYYASGGERQGPCGTSELGGLLRNGELSSQSQVWREGLSTWHRVEELPELLAQIPAPQAQHPAYAPAYSPQTLPYHAPASAPLYAPVAAPMPLQQSQGLDSLYRAYLVCLYVGIPAVFIIVGWFMLIAASILQLVLVARLWGILQDAPSEARTTPGKAIGFLFIPIFGPLYWIFQVYPGLASDMRAYGARRGIPISDEGGLGITAAIFALLGGVLSFFIFFPMFLGRMKDNAQRILEWKASASGVAATAALRPRYASY